MEGRLKVTPEKLRATASEMSSQGQTISAQTQQMMSLVNGLSSSWQGDASNTYLTKFKQLEDDITKINSMIQEHVRDLNDMAANYASAEARNQDAGNALRGDVIE